MPASRAQSLLPAGPEHGAAQIPADHFCRSEEFSHSPLIILTYPVSVGAALDTLDPLGVIQIPEDGFANTGFEGFGRRPTQLSFELAGINGITAIMSRSIGHMGNLLNITALISSGTQLIKQITDTVNDFQIGFFVPATDVIYLARNTSLQDPARYTTSLAGTKKPIWKSFTVSVICLMSC